MTFSATRTGRTVTRAGAFLKTRLWIWPIIAVVLLAIVGLTVRSAIESTMKKSLASQLTTLLNVETAMLATWFNVESAAAESAANDLQVREVVYRLIEDVPAAAEPEPAGTERTLHQQLQKELGPLMASQGFVGYFVANEKKQIVLASSLEWIGRSDIV